MRLVFIAFVMDERIRITPWMDLVASTAALRAFTQHVFSVLVIRTFPTFRPICTFLVSVLAN